MIKPIPPSKRRRAVLRVMRPARTRRTQKKFRFEQLFFKIHFIGNGLENRIVKFSKAYFYKSPCRCVD